MVKEFNIINRCISKYDVTVNKLTTSNYSKVSPTYHGLFTTLRYSLAFFLPKPFVNVMPF